MIQADLIRTSYYGDGTAGELHFKGYSCFTLELPWRNNEPMVSCIPQGKYTVQLRKSPKYGNIYTVTNVPKRQYILIHWGNFAGDTLLGYKSNVNGCILLGKKRGFIENQRAVLQSRPAVREFMEFLDGQPFELSIR